MNLEDVEDMLRQTLERPRPAPRAALLRVLMLPTPTRPAGSASTGEPRTRMFAELLIDCEEDKALRALLVGILRETDG